MAPRMVNECFPLKTRGFTTCIFGLAVCVGVCFSFSLGKIFGDTLEQNWKILMIIPPGYCLFRCLVILILFNHETPRQIVINCENIDEGLQKAEKVMMLYYDNYYEIEYAKEVLTQLESKRRFKESLKENQPFCYETRVLFSEGFMNRKTMYSTLATITFIVFPTISGQVFSDNYTIQVFDKLKEPKLGDNANFCSGFVVLFASIIS